MSEKIFDLNDTICEEMYWIRAQEYCHMTPNIDDAIDQVLEDVKSKYPQDERNSIEDRITQPFADRENIVQKDFYLQGIADGMDLAGTLIKIGKEKSHKQDSLELLVRLVLKDIISEMEGRKVVVNE